MFVNNYFPFIQALLHKDRHTLAPLNINFLNMGLAVIRREIMEKS